MEKTRNCFYDLLKAFGIISIVIGHICPVEEAVIFVYGYHVALFFYVAGALYNKDKYGEHPIKFAISKLKSLWLPYVLYTVPFTVVRKLTENPISPKSFILSVAKNFCLFGADPLVGALWFVPFMLMALAIFEGIMFISAKIFKEKYLIPVIVCCLAVGGIGLYLCNEWIPTPLHLKTCALMLPVMLVGWLIREYRLNPEKIFRWWALPVPIAASVYISNIKHLRVDLATDHFASLWGFYIVTFSGIYITATLSRYVQKVDFLSRVLAFIGKYSFDIMALHIAVHFLITYVFTKIGYNNQYVVFTVSLAFCLIIPPYVRIICAKVFARIKNAFGKKNKTVQNA